LTAVAAIVQEKVASSVYPALYLKPGGGYDQGWDFQYLLGALWLQKLWLLSTDPDQQRRFR
jgi:hypothetical protein